MELTTNRGMSSDSDCTMGGSDSDLPPAERAAESDQDLWRYKTADAAGSHVGMLKQRPAAAARRLVSMRRKWRIWRGVRYKPGNLSLAVPDEPGMDLPDDPVSSELMPFVPAAQQSVVNVGDRVSCELEAESTRLKITLEAVTTSKCLQLPPADEIPATTAADAFSLEDTEDVTTERAAHTTTTTTTTTEDVTTCERAAHSDFTGDGVRRRIRLRSKTPDPGWQRRQRHQQSNMTDDTQEQTTGASTNTHGQDTHPRGTRRVKLRKGLFPEGGGCAPGKDPNNAALVPPPTTPFVAPKPKRSRPRRGDDPNAVALVSPPPVPHVEPRPARGRPNTGAMVANVLEEVPLDKIIAPGSEDERWVRNHPLWIMITQRGYPLPFGEREILALKAYTPQRHGGDAVVSLT